jgi:hypothetical protein
VPAPLVASLAVKLGGVHSRRRCGGMQASQGRLLRRAAPRDNC